MEMGWLAGLEEGVHLPTQNVNQCD